MWVRPVGQRGPCGQSVQTTENVDTYRTGGDALLPLRHAQALLQARAFLHHHIPATVRILGPNAGAGNTCQRVNREAASPTKPVASKGEPGPYVSPCELVIINFQSAEGRKYLSAHTGKYPFKSK